MADRLPRVVDSRERRLAPESGGGGLKGKLANVPTWVWYGVGAVVIVVAYIWFTSKGSSGSPLQIPSGTTSSGGQVGAGGTTGGASDDQGTTAGTGTTASPVGSTSSGFVLPTSIDNGVASSGNTTSPVIANPSTFNPVTRFTQPQGGYATPASQRIQAPLFNPVIRFSQPSGGFASPASQRTVLPSAHNVKPAGLRKY